MADDRPVIIDGKLIGYTGESVLRQRPDPEAEKELREKLVDGLDFENLPEV